MPTQNPPISLPCQRTRYESCGKGGWYDWSEGKRAGVIIGVIVGIIIVVLLCGCINSKHRKQEKSQSVTLEEIQNEQRRLARMVDEQREIETSQAPPQTMVHDVPPTYQEAWKHREPTPPSAPTPMPTGRAMQMGDKTPKGWPPTYMQAASSSTVICPAPTAFPPSRAPYPALPSSPPR